MRQSKQDERTITVQALKRAMPYIRMFKGKVFVLKAGGDAFVSAGSTRVLMEQVGILQSVGIRVVVVHGGGPQSTELAGALGVSSKFVDGRRVTDQRSLEVATMVLNGQINTRILAGCRDLGIAAVGISGVDAGLVKAHRRPPVAASDDSDETVDYGFVGDIDEVDVGILQRQLDDDLVPVVSPLSADDTGTLLNINADTVAAAIAEALRAEKLILATGVPGILATVDDPSQVFPYLDLPGIRTLRRKNMLSDGMLPKADAIESALGGGVPRVHVISYKQPDSLLMEVFTNEGVGTLVIRDLDKLLPRELKGQG